MKRMRWTMNYYDVTEAESERLLGTNGPLESQGKEKPLVQRRPEVSPGGVSTSWCAEVR